MGSQPVTDGCTPGPMTPPPPDDDAEFWADWETAVFTRPTEISGASGRLGHRERTRHLSGQLFPQSIHSVYSRRREHRLHPPRPARAGAVARLRAQAGLRPALRHRQAAAVRPGVRHARPARARRPGRRRRHRVRRGPRTQALRHHRAGGHRPRALAGGPRGARAAPPDASSSPRSCWPCSRGATPSGFLDTPAGCPPRPDARAHRAAAHRRRSPRRCSPTTPCSTSKPTSAGSSSPPPGSTTWPRR